MTDTPYDLIIGLEVHVQLLTQTKLFCRCTTEFGLPPNTATCPVCLGLPGSLPVMNREAFRLSLKTAVALHCEIPSFTKWDRKNYYYPDLPKGYQISQYDLPMSQKGWLLIDDPKGRFTPKKVGIIRAHLEEDAGKSMHDEVHGKADSRVDLNRAGTPLLEIVSEPDMRSPLEAKAYLEELKLTLLYLGVSDCNMQEGSLRVDANVNIHVHDGGKKIATPIVEIKNMNSFRAVEKALAHEAQRQYSDWKETGKTIKDAPKTTRGWDDQKEVTTKQREKEDSADYRYFPEPDLAPVTVSESELATVKSEMIELPGDIRRGLESKHGIPPYDSDVIVNQGRPFLDYYLQVAEGVGYFKLASNWVQQEVLRLLNERGETIDKFPTPPPRLIELIKAIQGGDIDNSRAKEVFNEMVATGQDAKAVMKARGIEKVDESALIALCEEVVAANPKIVADVKGGKVQAAGNLVGQAKKKNPNIDPNRVRAICIEIIAKM